MKDKSFRVLVVCTDYRPRLGGVATCTFEVAKALSQRPHVQVRVITKVHPKGDEFDSHGFFSTKRVTLSSFRVLSIFKLACFVAIEIVRFRPHCILNFLWIPCGVASWLITPVRLLMRVPYFIIVHGVEILETNTNWRKRFRKSLSFVKSRVLRGAKKVFPVSHFTAHQLSSQCHLPEEKIKIIGNGVNTEEFYPQPKSLELLNQLKLSGKTVFFTLSRLENYKGIDRTIAAMKRVVQKYPNTVYLIGGEGKDRARLERLVIHYRVQKHVIFLGPIPFERLRDYYSITDCFVLNTREDWEAPNVEGFGLVFLEAAACRVPSIGGQSGGIPDAILKNSSGWLVDPTDDEKIAEAMIQVMSDPLEREKRAQFAYDRAVQTMKWSQVAEKIWSEVILNVRN